MEANDFPQYTKDDFLEGNSPFEYIYGLRDNRFEQERAIARMSMTAKEVGVKNFVTLYKAYEKSKKTFSPSPYDNSTNYEGQEFELATGTWKADDMGVTMRGVYGEIVACTHPIMPIMRLTNIDTGIEKMKIAYKKGKNWRSTIEDKKTLASNNLIIELANKGIAVNSDSAKHLVKFLSDAETYNYERIPEKYSVSRLGWIEGKGFSPYVDELVFDGDANYKTFFESVHQKGNYSKWLEMAKKVRRESIYGRIILAASFASVLVAPLSCLPFIVHVWGGTEAGKTVGLMLAASVWANPEMGRFIHTFNSTSVGREKSASFVNSLPLILDELQIMNDRKQFDTDIYMLCEGAGRTRGNKSGGIEKSGTWSNCILTSGEQPITNSSSGSGAINRIIEVECKEKMFLDPRYVADTVRKNYGQAGKMFIQMLNDEDNLNRAVSLFNQFKNEFDALDTTEKQVLAICTILTADSLASEWIFNDKCALKVTEVIEFLQTRKAVSANEKGYLYICEYIVSNKHKFCGESDIGEVWGGLDADKGKAYIVRNHFNRICDEGGYNPQAFLSWLKHNGKIETNVKGFTKAKRINGIPCNCVILTLLAENDNPFIQEELV